MNVLDIVVDFVGTDAELTSDYMGEYVANRLPTGARLDSWEVKPLRRKDVSQYETIRSWRWVGEIIATVVIE